MRLLSMAPGDLIKCRGGLTTGFLDPTNTEQFWKKPNDPLAVKCGRCRVLVDSPGCWEAHDASATVWVEEPAFRAKISSKISISSRPLRSQVYSSAVRAACDPSWSRNRLSL